MRQRYPQTNTNFFYDAPHQDQNYNDLSPLYVLKHEISRGDLEPQGPKAYVEVPDLPEEYGFENVNACKEFDEIFKQSIKNI